MIFRLLTPCLACIIIFASTAVSAQDYLWPTDASKHLTSNYCEFRPRHFHAAVDIKTWQRTGYKIFAIEDGYVYRLRVSATGYGKVVYLKLRDGNLAVYAHLDGFTPELTQYADSLRQTNRNNILDSYPRPDQFPVKKGQHIGYTGETGIGVPHLHFEIRNKYHHPINPLQFYPDTVVDNISPKSRFLAVVPLSADAFINFRPDTLFVPLTRRQTVTIPAPIYLTGRSHLALRSYDLANGVNNVLDIYRGEMLINDSLVYSMRYDKFSYDETRLIELDKNFSLWRKGLRVYHNFYRHPLNSLPFYGETRREAGELNAKTLRPGENKIELRVYDFHGNKHSVSMTIIYHSPGVAEIFNASRIKNGSFIGIKSPKTISHFEVNRVNADLSRMTKISNYEQRQKDKILDHYYYHLLIPDSPGNTEQTWLQVIPYADKEPELPLYIPTVSEQQEGVEKTISDPPVFYGSRFRWNASREEADSTARLIRGAKVIHTSPSSATVIGSSIALQNYLGDGSDTHPGWTMVIPGQEAVVSSVDRSAQLFFRNTAAYDTLNVRIIRKNPAFPLNAPYRYLSPVYETQPFDQPMNYGAVFRIQLSDSAQTAKGVGIYYLDSRKGWLFLPTQYDDVTRQHSARVTSLEPFVAIQDTIPPALSALNASTFLAISDQSEPLTFKVKDEMAGFYGEQHIEVRIDNRWSIFDFDPEEDLIYIHPRVIPAGATLITISITDNAGNRALKSFRVNRL